MGPPGYLGRIANGRHCSGCSVWVKFHQKNAWLIRRFRVYDNIGLLARDPKQLDDLLNVARINNGVKKVGLSLLLMSYARCKSPYL